MEPWGKVGGGIKAANWSSRTSSRTISVTQCDSVAVGGGGGGEKKAARGSGEGISLRPSISAPAEADSTLLVSLSQSGHIL